MTLFVREGFGFFRIYNLIWLADIATNRAWMSSAVKVRVIRLLVLVVAIVVIAAGFLHLVSTHNVLSESVDCHLPVFSIETHGQSR